MPEHSSFIYDNKKQCGKLAKLEMHSIWKKNNGMNSLYSDQENLLYTIYTWTFFVYGSLAEEEVKTESDAIEGMEIATRSKGMKNITFWNDLIR